MTLNLPITPRTKPEPKLMPLSMRLRHEVDQSHDLRLRFTTLILEIKTRTQTSTRSDLPLMLDFILGKEVEGTSLVEFTRNIIVNMAD